jgi:nucleotide-binding universal stress UspA family protein
MMGPIVCATRGGEASVRTQERAIQLAQENDTGVCFLYVADPCFAGQLDEPMAEVLVDELAQLGESLLHLAQLRAQEHGLKAEVIIRRGDTQRHIQDYVTEVGASILVLGSPQSDAESQAFDPKGMNQFAREIHEKTGVDVVVVP